MRTAVSAQSRQSLFPARGGVWARDYLQTAWPVLPLASPGIFVIIQTSVLHVFQPEIKHCSYYLFHHVIYHMATIQGRHLISSA